MILVNKIKAAAGKMFFLAAVFIYTFLFFSCSKSPVAPLVKYLYPGDVQMWKHIYSNSDAYVIPKAFPDAIILPHHDITASQQNSFYKALSEQGQPSVIIVVAPDHFEVGKKQIVIPENTIFDAPEGLLEVADLQKKLQENKLIGKYVEQTDEPWEMEHGIFIHTPFLKHYFPQAEFFPILVKSFSKDEEFEIYENLANVLNEILPEESLVIASVDFSHYQIPRMTELHDYVSMNTIQLGEDLKHIEVDSPESLTVASVFAHLRGADEKVLIDRTCTYDYIPDDFVVSTSHQYWTFYKKEHLPLIHTYEEEVQETQQRYSKIDTSRKNHTILIGGSGTLGAGVRYSWDWDRYQESKDPVEQKLYDLAGTEARFLEGFDALIFDVEPGLVYSSKKHGTSLVVKGLSAQDITSDSFDINLIPVPAENELNIFVVTTDSDPENEFLFKNNFPRISALGKKCELIIFRDSKGEKDAYVWFSKPTEIYNLGVLIGKDKIKGSILCVNWYNGKCNVELFDYESDNGLPPSIFQGEI